MEGGAFVTKKLEFSMVIITQGSNFGNVFSMSFCKSSKIKKEFSLLLLIASAQLNTIL
jgi:hypothetical protein